MSNLITPIHLKMKEDAEKTVMNDFKVSKDVFMSKSRTGECSNARFAAWVILRHKNDLPYNVISKMYNKDHATVIAGVKSAIMRLLPQMVGVDVYLKPLNKKRG